MDQSKLKIAQLESNQGNFEPNDQSLNKLSTASSEQLDSIRFLQCELEKLKEVRKKEQVLFENAVKQRDLYKEKLQESNLVIYIFVFDSFGIIY